MNNNITNLITKVEIFSVNQASKSLGLLSIEQNTNFSSFTQQVSKLTEIRASTRILLNIQGELIMVETNQENFEFIKKTILDQTRKKAVYFIMIDLEDLTKRIDVPQKKGKIQAGFGEYAGDMEEFDFSIISVLDSLTWKDDIDKTGLFDQINVHKPIKPTGNENVFPEDSSNKNPIPSNEDMNSNSKKDDPNNEQIPRNNEPKANQLDQPQNQVINPNNLPPSHSGENKINSEVKLLLNGREIQIKPDSIRAFNENYKRLNCFHCQNFLFGAKTCKSCFNTYCSTCLSSSTKCPDSDCASNSFEEMAINESIRAKLSKVLLECEKECGEDNISMFNYEEHLKKCEGNFKN